MPERGVPVASVSLSRYASAMIPAVTLLVVVILSMLVTRVATIALVHTGITQQTASFQARSAFTGVGFTTSEAEQIVNHPVRRRIVMTLMLLGNAGIVTVVASFVLSFAGVSSGESVIARVLVLAGGIAALWGLTRSEWVNRRINSIIGRMLDKHTRLETRDYESLLHVSGEYRIGELRVEPGDWMAGRALSELRLRDEGIMVLGIVANDGTYFGAPDGDSQIREGDTLLLYARAPVIDSLDRRRRDPSGDEEHERMVAEQARLEDEQGDEERQ